MSLFAKALAALSCLYFSLAMMDARLGLADKTLWCVCCLLARRAERWRLDLDFGGVEFGALESQVAASGARVCVADPQPCAKTVRFAGRQGSLLGKSVRPLGAHTGQLRNPFLPEPTLLSWTLGALSTQMGNYGSIWFDLVFLLQSFNHQGIRRRRESCL